MACSDFCRFLTLNLKAPPTINIPIVDRLPAPQESSKATEFISHLKAIHHQPTTTIASINVRVLKGQILVYEALMATTVAAKNVLAAEKQAVENLQLRCRQGTTTTVNEREFICHAEGQRRKLMGIILAGYGESLND